MTLGDLLGMVNDPYLLKMDCKGCEYDVILNSKRSGELKQIQDGISLRAREAGGGPEVEPFHVIDARGSTHVKEG
ncbi:MAG: hypothetical protein RXO24_06105 [Acidilobus sp.]|jgi:hypothetical protein